MSMQAQDCIDIAQIKSDLSNIVDKCSCDNPLVLGVPDQTTNISTYQLGALVKDECIEVLGTVVIDQQIRFENCDFIFEDGALIRTSTFLPVEFIGCNLQSCGDYFWSGIQLGWGNTFYFRNNTMQHAYNGIHSTLAPVYCYINDNVFNNNRHAIKLDDSDFIQVRRSELTLNGNIFGKTDDLKLHWEESPHWNHEVSYGVETNFAIVNALVGNDPCERTNIFVGLHDGYFLRNTVSQIDANLFHDFEPIEGNSWSGSGVSCHAFSSEDIGLSSLTLRGWPTNDIATFRNIPFSAIWAGFGSVDVQSCIIESTRTGVANGVPFFRNWIKDNKIHAEETGILAMRISNTNSIIANNVISIKNPGDPNYITELQGISIWSEFDGGRVARINYNSINLDPGYGGIRSIGSRNTLFNIACNSIYIKETIEGYANGIELMGGYLNRLADNSVHGQYTTSSVEEVNGIKIVESQANELISNYVNNTQIGLHFSNYCSNTSQEMNRMSNHDIGYFISETGATGDQYYSANQWLGSYGDFAAQNLGDVDNSIYHDYQNFVTTNCWPQSIDADPGWFIPVGGSGTCGGIPPVIPCTQGERPVLSFLTSLDTLVARGELEFIDFEDRRIWQAERYLLRVLVDFPDLIGASGSLMDRFMVEASSSSLWDYQEMWSLIDYHSSIPDSIFNQWEQYYEIYEDLIEDVELAIVDWLDFPDSLELAELISSVNEEIDSIWSLSSSMVQTWRQESIDNLISLLPDIASLSTPNQYASSEKLIMAAKIRMTQSLDSISGSMRTSLIQLAESCILEHGPSVIEARVIMRQFEYQPDAIKLNCAESGGARIIDPNRLDNSLFELYPNPSAGNFNLKLNSSINEDGEIKLYDQTGKLVHSEKISTSGRLIQVSVSHLPIGQYNVKVRIGSKEHVRSLIIAR